MWLFFRAGHQIAFPMTGDGAVLDFCGSFPNGDGIDDLPADCPCSLE